MLDIGKFDRMIEICMQDITTDEMGGKVYSLSTGFVEYAFVEWKDGKSGEDMNAMMTEQVVEFTIRNVSSEQMLVNANTYVVKFPTDNGTTILNQTQYYTVEGTRIWGGREKYKTLICKISTNAAETY